MPYILLAITFSLFVANVIKNYYLENKIKTTNINYVEINTTTKRLENIDKISIQYKLKNEQSKPLKQKELVERTLIRTCNTIYQKGIWYRCSNFNKASIVWKFVGNIGTEGYLSTAWTGATTATFSCGKEKEYGRYLVQNAIPKKVIIDNNWGYNLKDVNDGDTSYPCGYSEIVTIK